MFLLCAVITSSMEASFEFVEFCVGIYDSFFLGFLGFFGSWLFGWVFWGFGGRDVFLLHSEGLLELAGRNN